MATKNKKNDGLLEDLTEKEIPTATAPAEVIYDTDYEQDAEGGKVVKPNTKDVSDAANKATIKPKPSKAAPGEIPSKKHFTIKTEDIGELFGEELSEDFKTKAATIFEAAVNGKIDEILPDLVEEKVAEVRTEMATSVNDFLEYTTQEWLSENQIAVDSGLRAEMAEEFILGLKKLFQESYIEIPEGKTDVIAELEAKNAELSEEYQKAIAKIGELNETLTDAQADQIFEETTKDLAESQKDRLGRMMGSVTWSTPSEFGKKLEILKESIVNKSGTKESTTQKAAAILTEEYHEDADSDQPQARKNVPTEHQAAVAILSRKKN